MRLKDVSRLYEIGMFNGKYDREHANEHFIFGIETVMEVVNDIPDIDPESLRPTGHWVWDENGNDWGIGAWMCSECGCKNDNLGVRKDGGFSPYFFAGSKYCPQCGVRMVKPNENEV